MSIRKALGRGARRTGVLLSLLVAFALPAVANADHTLTDRLSAGPAGGNAELNAYFRGASADGKRVFIETDEALVDSDTDGLQDVYERYGTSTTLVSLGPASSNGAYAASFAGVSDDGTRVLFFTREPLVGTDGDTAQDVYERSGSTTTLRSGGSTGGNGTNPATFLAVSSDGARVVFHTTERLVAGDTDSARDIYEHTSAGTTLVSTGPAGGNGNFNAIYQGASSDATRVFFQTLEKLTSDDLDGQTDVYQRAGGATTRLSLGPAGGNGTTEDLYDAFFAGSSADGTRVFIETDEPLTSEDVDIYTDVYERSGSTTTWLSRGAIGGNGDAPADFRAASADGSRVFIQTDEPLELGDADVFGDVYQRLGGATTLISTGPLDTPAGLFDASFAGASQDGTRVFFATALSLVDGDLDVGWRDTYERAGGVTTLVSAGSSATGPFNAYFHGSSTDGTRVFFQTDEPLINADSDAQVDVYERAAGATTLLSIGAGGGNGAFGASFAGASRDGRRVFVHSGESLLAPDSDGALDVYHTVPSGSYPRPIGAAKVRLTLLPAFKACASPNTSHGAPLSRPACSPAVQASDHLTVLNNDSSRASGSLTLRIFCTNAETPPCASPGEQQDAKLIVNAADIRRKSDGADYAGELEARLGLRITDRFNGFGGENATASELALSATVGCTGNADPALGSSCAVNTTVNALIPGAVIEGARSIWQLADVKLYDGGPDGLASTQSGNTVFLRQGVFVP